MLTINDNEIKLLKLCVENRYIQVSNCILKLPYNFYSTEMPDIISATSNGHYDIVKLILENGGKVDQKDFNGDTALIVAARYGKNDIMELLLSHGANVHHENYRGDNAILACSDSYVETIQILISNKAFLNKKNQSGRTLLMEMIIRRSYDEVELLLRNGANVNYEDNNGYTCLDLAYKSRAGKQIEVLLMEYGAKRNKVMFPLYYRFV